MLGKILLTIIVVALIGFGFKYLSRRAEMKARAPDRPIEPRPGAAQAMPEAETMVECRVCKTWQPQSSAKSCGRSDCPY